MVQTCLSIIERLGVQEQGNSLHGRVSCKWVAATVRSGYAAAVQRQQSRHGLCQQGTCMPAATLLAAPR
jgi:hypothetical protein